MKIAYITAGAAGMYCGSCLHDNTLAAALIAQGHDALLIPTYTPIRTDEEDVSQPRLFFGGVNVYLQQKIPLFRYTPRFLDRWLDAPSLIRWLSGLAVNIEAKQLGALTLAMLEGSHGPVRKEVRRLCHWLASEIRPEIINLTNVMLSGMVPDLKQCLGVPILISLQGDDIFLEMLPEPHRSKVLAKIRERCRQVDGFIATSSYYADFMTEYLGFDRKRIHVVLPGINLSGHGVERLPSDSGIPVIGYFARICPEKGLHLLVEAFRRLRQTHQVAACKLRVSGYLGPNNQPYFEELQERIKNWGLADHFEHVDAPDHASKLQFLQRLDILSVPTVYREPKGLYILESLANGVPVVQPRHGSFPELVEATGGGILVEPKDPEALARGLRQLLNEPDLRGELGRRGKERVHQRFHAAKMASETIDVYSQYVR